MRPLLFLVLFVLVSCATRTPVTNSLTKKHSIAEKHRISNVPVIAQKKNHCGPASLAMVLGFHGKERSPDELAKDLFQKDLGGTFRSDILASARREGMMAMEINDLSKALEEVHAGNPVLVFQNLGLSIMPQWHFSVLRGYDLDGPDVYLNSGKNKEEKMDMRLFERSWVLGGEWGALILPPEKLGKTSSEFEHVEAASLLEGAGKIQEALKAYQAILARWPESHLALIGVANASYHLDHKGEAEKFLIKATRSKPRSATAWHNLAIIQGELGKKRLARKSARRALGLADQEKLHQFKVSLKDYL